MSNNTPPCRTGPFGWPRQAAGAATEEAAPAASNRADVKCGKGHTCPLLRSEDTPTTCNYRSVDWSAFDDALTDVTGDDLEGMVVELDCGTVIVPTERSFPRPSSVSYEETPLPVPPTKQEVLDLAKAQLVAQANVEKAIQPQAPVAPVPTPESKPKAESAKEEAGPALQAVKVVSTPEMEGKPTMVVKTDANGEAYISPAPPILTTKYVMPPENMGYAKAPLRTNMKYAPMAQEAPMALQEIVEAPPPEAMPNTETSEETMVDYARPLSNAQYAPMMPTEVTYAQQQSSNYQYAPMVSAPMEAMSPLRNTELLAEMGKGDTLPQEMAPTKGAGRTWPMKPLFAYDPASAPMLPAYPPSSGFSWDTAGEVIPPPYPQQQVPPAGAMPKGYQGMWGARGDIGPAPAGCASGACPMSSAAKAIPDGDALDLAMGIVPAGETWIPAYDSYNPPAGETWVPAYPPAGETWVPAYPPAGAVSPRVHRRRLARRPAGLLNEVEAEQAILEAKLGQIASAGSMPVGIGGLWPTGSMPNDTSIAYRPSRPAGKPLVGMGAMWGGGGIVKAESEYYTAPGGALSEDIAALSLASGDFPSPAGAADQLGGTALQKPQAGVPTQRPGTGNLRPTLTVGEATAMLDVAKKIIAFKTWPDFQAVETTAGQAFGGRKSGLAVNATRDQWKFGNRFQRVLLSINDLEAKIAQEGNGVASATLSPALSTKVVAVTAETCDRCRKYERFSRCLYNALIAVMNLDPEKVRQHVLDLQPVRPDDLNPPKPAGQVDDFDRYVWYVGEDEEPVFDVYDYSQDIRW